MIGQPKRGSLLVLLFVEISGVTHMVGGSSSSSNVMSDRVYRLLSTSIVVCGHGACATIGQR